MDEWFDEAADTVASAGPVIEMWMALYQKCLDADMPEELAIHFVKQLMGERIPPS